MKDSNTISTHDDRRWTVLSSKYLWRRPWLTVRLEHVRLANGREAPEFYILEYPDWINVIAITKDGEMVMIRQYRHGVGRSDYELCAGVIEEGENPEDAARRELLEETGFGGGEWTQFARLAPNPSTQTNWTYSYLAVGVEKIDTQHLDGAEDISVHLMSKSQVLQLLRDGEIIQALMAAPLWKYFATSGML
ncbi:MAG: NUDIX hydrolase [Muribaculaceae bacterium]|nr:NUDIX hydrolase [Muribaculaceae bacterium]MDE6644859.1 NUDIX hydrolase [Muribaculaceae bacterium]